MKDFFFCMCFLICFLGCKEDAPSDHEGDRALVIYTGEPEVDGCGYVLYIADRRFKPLNLPAKYQKDSLNLLVTYDIDPAGFPCGDLPDPITTIRLTSILER